MKSEIIEKLRSEILLLEGFKPRQEDDTISTGLDFMLPAFPGNAFPMAAVHEFISHSPEDAAATSGFIAGLLSGMMKKKGPVVWVCQGRTIFPPALQVFGISPEEVLFVDTKKEVHALWAVEEALRCSALSAVVGDIRELDFSISRRLQLAVESSRIPGFIHRHNPRNRNANTCIARWHITALPSISAEGLPGVGDPCWNIELTRIRNGKPGAWDLTWKNGRFEQMQQAETTVIHAIQKAVS